MLKHFFSKYKYELLVLSFICIIVLIPIYRITESGILYAIDSWFHAYFTKFTEPQSLFNDTLQFSDDSKTAHYPSFMRTLLYLLSLITGVEIYDEYRYFGVVMRILLLLGMYSIGKKLFNNKKLALFGVLLLATGDYFYGRIYVTFTENFVLFIHTIILYFAIGYLQVKKDIYLYLTSFFTAISFYFHPPSSIISLLIFGYILLYLLLSKRIFSFFSQIFFVGILSLGVLYKLIKEIINQYTYNVGHTGGYGDLNRFTPPVIKDYIQYQSGVLVVLGIIGLIMLIAFLFQYFKNKDYKRFSIIGLLLLLTLFTFILSNGTRFGLNLPTGRMQSFLMIPIAISGLFAISKIKSRDILSLLSFFLIFLSFKSSLMVHSWTPVKEKHKELGIFLQMNYNSDIHYYFEDVNGLRAWELRFEYPSSIIRDIEHLEDGDYYITNRKNLGYNIIFSKYDIFIYEFNQKIYKLGKSQ